MHIQKISATVSKEALSRLLQGARFPDGVTLVDLSLADGAVLLVLRIASFFGIPVRVKLEFDSVQGSRVVFKATPPINLSMAESPNAAQPNRPEAVSRNRHTPVELDLVRLSKGIIKTATIKHLSINKSGISIQVEDLEADPQKVSVTWQSL
jgi:hypothetical protein